MRKFVSALILALAVSFVLPVVAETKKEPAKVVAKTVVTPKVIVKGEVKVTQPVVVLPKEVPASQPVVTATTEPTATVQAEEPTISEWWKVAVRYALEIIFSILGIVATGFVTVLMKKYGFEAYSAKVAEISDRAIGYAEQKSLQALKLTGKPLGSAEKMALALDIALAAAKEYKLADKGKVWWESKLEGWLGTAKLNS